MVFGQDIHPYNGAPPSEIKQFGIRNADVLLENAKILKGASLFIENGRISKIGENVKFPEGTIVYDYAGKTILASFVELSSTSGIQDHKHDKANEHNRAPQFLSNKLGPYYWNESIMSEFSAIEHYNHAEQHNNLEQMGFGFVVPHNTHGVARGTGPLIAIGLKPDQGGVLSNAVAAFFSLDKAHSRQTYPSSQMGVIALLQQAMIDALWYGQSKDITLNFSLKALYEQLKGTLIFEVQDKWEVLRAAKILDEFNLNAIIRCGGDEYQRIEAIKALKHEFILPLRFPQPIDVANAFVAREIPLQILKHWELAPSNPYTFYLNHRKFALTAQGISTDEAFWAAVRLTIERGLPWQEAYQSLTTFPASLIGMEKEIGALREGAWASFKVYTNNPFLNKRSELLESWQMGQRKVHKELQNVDIRGDYNINIKGQYYSMFVRGSLEKPSAKIVKGADVLEKNASEKSVEAKFSFDGVHVSLSFKDDNINNGIGVYLLNGEFYTKFGTIEGQGLSPEGNNIQWSAIRHKDFSEKESVNIVQVDSIPMSRLWFPNMAYGLDDVPKHSSYLIRNATIWTGEADEVIENGDILVVNGKIKYLGTGSVRVPDGTKVIEAHGKFVTAGIIDEHSHIAISKGVNESGLSITSEVSIQTVINPDDVNIYRQLAGGVTCSQLLHGSANAIGGQSAIIKLKWGYDAEGLLLKNQPKFIKFALGENVKQANWGDFNVTRFPQTRMGVEQVYYDAFNRAKYYHQDNKSKGNSPFRRDLRLQALAEILNGERHITCHSYVQSEINMLMKVADSMGFKINTFTHILEGYKLTEQMVKHGAGGSTFSDWWAYKYEVIDAIPHNACMMNKAGVVTAINSDDAEMGRRLNQEAAKGVKYGGMTEQEAWRMVTINPAKLLRIDDRMGSIKVGKDADLVIWSHNPLSVNAVCEQTFIDGILFYDIRQQEARQKRNEKERVRLIALMQEAIKKGASPVAFIYKHQPLYHCDTEEHHTHHHHGH